MKASELKALLHTLPDGNDPELVTGDIWLPEQLVNAYSHDDFLFLDFDNAPEEEQGEEEGRGFVEHEVELIRQQIARILQEDSGQKAKTEALLALLLVAHERTSAEFIEMLGSIIFEEGTPAE
ncbi:MULTISPECIES: VC1380 family protein [Vibrio]|uniref:Uncharacterized protein n=2 Tax=Vibrio TaxID=662 RepID=A0A7X4RWJ8_9VIBR|nr:hypothetical protein [Vibrio nitrifigilis]MBF9000431.1 hypothetical protein [Vibrio nitrifigilis]MZI95422.1 hypothetical protein [Vibrio eleionomae]